jgi:DNA-directed RNA polymerase I subunit RPA49
MHRMTVPRYYVAVHNKRTKTTVLRPAPTHILQREPKALKGIPPAAVSAADRITARAALGAVFGTKKAQAALRATERNKVDVTAMEGVVGHLQDRIAANTGVLPTQGDIRGFLRSVKMLTGFSDEAKASADAARLIPEHDPDAADPSGVYPLHNIIPEAEFSALSVSRLLAAKTDFERLALLPHSRSSWVQQHLALAFASPKPRKEHM